MRVLIVRVIVSLGGLRRRSILRRPRRRCRWFLVLRWPAIPGSIVITDSAWRAWRECRAQLGMRLLLLLLVVSYAPARGVVVWCIRRLVRWRKWRSRGTCRRRRRRRNLPLLTGSVAGRVSSIRRCQLTLLLWTRIAPTLARWCLPLRLLYARSMLVIVRVLLLIIPVAHLHMGDNSYNKQILFSSTHVWVLRIIKCGETAAAFAALWGTSCTRRSAPQLTKSPAPTGTCLFIAAVRRVALKPHRENPGKPSNSSP